MLVEAYHFGDPAQADELLGPLRALGPVNDTITTVSVPALSHLHMDPEQPVPGRGDGMMVASLPGEAIDALAETVGPGAAFPLTSVEVRHLGRAALDRPRLPAAAPDQGGRRLRRPDPVQPPDPASPLRATRREGRGRQPSYPAGRGLDQHDR